MNEDTQDKRIRQRIRLSLPARVRCRESLDAEWMEITRLIDVTPFGASFGLSHPTERGRLLHLTLPLPRQLRSFDHAEDQYRVWSLVRSAVRQAAPSEAGGSAHAFVVGVAFVGKHPPAGYEQNPSQRYEPGDTLEASKLRAIVGQAARGPRVERRTRLTLSIEVTLEVIGEGSAAAREETVTENISRQGAAVYTTLKLAPGRFVRLTGVREQITILAVVRQRSEGPGGVARLHLEFVDREWPLDQLF